MILKIAIADVNGDYAERISDVLGANPEVKVSMYTDKSKLELAITSKSIDVLLFDPSIYTGEVGLKNDTLAVMLVDDEMPIPETCKSFKKVKKYQRVSKTYNKILEYYSEFCPSRGIAGEGGTRVISFYSPIGGSGKTTVSLAVSARLASMGKKVFYLNLEEIASDGFYLSQNADHGLSELATQIGEKVNFSMKIQSLLLQKSENFSYLKHFDSPNDYYDLDEEETKGLIDLLVQSSLFDYIIVDLGISLDKKMLTVFDSSDKIVIVEKYDNASVQKLMTFFDQAHIINSFAEKMIRVQNFSYGGKADITDKVQLGGVINTVMNPDAAQFVDMLAKDASLSFVSLLDN